MFIGESLTNLRILHGYSRKQLSEMLGVTERVIWQYENNYTSPEMMIINKLKGIFGVKSKYFYQDDVLDRYVTTNNISLMNIAYRSKVMNNISKAQTETKHIQFLDAFVNYLTSQVTYPTQKIIQIRDKVIQYMNASNEVRKVQIEKVAKIARKQLGLLNNTNDNLMFLIEKSGVFIFEKAIGENIDAYSLWTNEERPFVILGNMKRSAVRRNFDLAHELGHLLLHYRVEFTSLDKEEYKEMENEANQFASAFLLPEDTVLPELGSITYSTNPDAYIDLKVKWKASLQVLAYRAADLGIIEAKEHRNFYATLHRRGYLKQEPLDEMISIQRPQKMKSIFDLVIRKGLIHISKMMEKDWMVDMKFFHQMTGIDLTFFNRYIASEQHIGKNNITYLSADAFERKA